VSYEIKIPQFEGPFDLLLFFIERDEIEIYDIPIADITEDFLHYIQQAKELNIELASEFILVAATLMHIKARMLIPRKELDEEGNEIDPRQELIEKLIEYKQYKEASTSLSDMEEERAKMFTRGYASKEIHGIADRIQVESELASLSMYKLLTVFEKVMDRHKKANESARHLIYHFPYTIDDQKTYLLQTVKKEVKASFESIFLACKDRLQAIFTFLAMLELIQQKELSIEMGVGYNNIMVTGFKAS